MHCRAPVEPSQGKSGAASQLHNAVTPRQFRNGGNAVCHAEKSHRLWNHFRTAAFVHTGSWSGRRGRPHLSTGLGTLMYLAAVFSRNSGVAYTADLPTLSEHFRAVSAIFCCCSARHLALVDLACRRLTGTRFDRLAVKLDGKPDDGGKQQGTDENEQHLPAAPALSRLVGRNCLGQGKSPCGAQARLFLRWFNAFRSAWFPRRHSQGFFGSGS